MGKKLVLLSTAIVTVAVLFLTGFYINSNINNIFNVPIGKMETVSLKAGAADKISGKEGGTAIKTKDNVGGGAPQKQVSESTGDIKKETTWEVKTTRIDQEAKKIVDNVLDYLVLVNKKNCLPAGFVPPDLVKPQIKFSFEEDLPKKLMRKEAAAAVENLFQQAGEEGIDIAGVSAYRSYERQQEIFNYKARQMGEEANKISAHPGESEHQTGLAIDVSCSRVGYNLSEAFGETIEGRWLVENAPKHGFIIRYPRGKEDITGYNYEPWHIRYVGIEAAGEIASRNITLEQFLANEQ